MSTPIIPAIPADMLETYKQFIIAKAEAEAASSRADALKAKILAKHAELGEPKFKSDGFSSSVYSTTKEYLNRAEIEKRFGTLPPECIKVVTSECIRISGKVVNA